MDIKSIKKFVLIPALIFMLMLFGACSLSGTDNVADTAAESTVYVPDKQYLSTGPDSEYDLGGDSVYVCYTVNSSAAGYIDGETKQEITDVNNHTSVVKAIANLGYKYVCWSDGSTNVSRARDAADESTVITAIFDYDVLEMPVFSITTETGSDVTSKTTYINATFDIGGTTFSAADRVFQVHNDLSENGALCVKQLSYITDYIQRCWDAVKDGKRDIIESLMDINSLIDTYLVEEVTKNLDVGYDSYYLYKDRGGKLCFGPLWDFDLSLGNANEGCEYYTDLYAAVNLKGQSNQWYYTMMDFKWFRDLLLQKWDNIKDRLNALPTLVDDMALIYYNSFCRNFEKWQIFGTSQNRETSLITSLKSYMEHYKYLAEWIKNRITWIDEYIHTDAYLTGINPYNDNTVESVYGNDITKEIMTKYEILNKNIVYDTISSSGGGFDGGGIANAFDGNESTKYCFVSDGETVITFGTSEKITMAAYVFRTANDTLEYPDRNPDIWVIYGSDDAAGTWNVIAESSAQEAEMGDYNFVNYGLKVDKPGSYMYYKIIITSYKTLQFSEFIIYG